MFGRRQRNRSTSAAFLGLALSFVLGCAESQASEPVQPRLQRLTLSEVLADSRPDAPESIAKLVPADDRPPAPGLTAIRFESSGGEEAGIVPSTAPDGASTWSVLASEPASLRWYWSGPACEFQRALVTLRTTGFARARFHVYGREEHITEGEVALPLEGRAEEPTVTTLVFEVPSTYHETRDVVFVELAVEPHVPTRIEVLSVELVHVPLRAALASVAEEPRFARVCGDERRAFGLSSWVPLHTRCTPEPDSVLSFSCAVPDALAKQTGPLSLEVELTGERGGPTNKILSLAPCADGANGWLDVELPLATANGASISVEWRLIGSDRKQEAVCALTPPILARRAKRPPSVLLVTSDTHRADHVSAAGLRYDVSTPEIDRLMARGLWFSNCLSPSNATTPSHAAILTGTSPRDTRIVDNITALTDDATTLAERFREAGWLTWAVVSADHLDDFSSGLGQGFDRLSVPHEFQRDAHETIACAERWLDTQCGLPVFLWVHLFDAHTPYSPDPQFLDRQWPVAADPFDPALPEPAIPDPARALMPPGLRDLEYMRACYRAEIGSLDAELPRLFEHPRLAGGVIAFTADHGESLGAHGIFWDHRGLYPQSTQVPLILSWPGGPHGVRSDRPVTNLDLSRTLLDLAGLAAEPFPGRSLVEESETAPEPRFMLASGGLSAAVQHDGWLAVLTLMEDPVWIGGQCHEPSRRHALELYDLRLDPRCTDDRTADEPELAARMRGAIVSWLAAASGPGFAGRITHDERMLASLRALGYATDATDVTGAWIDPACTCDECAVYHR